jgi:1-acyl-sn-glycerol-3-phosphate acyltransferase
LLKSFGLVGGYMAQGFSSRSKEDAVGIEWPARHSRLATSFEAFCRTMFKFYCPLTVTGSDHLPEPPFIICSNHASHLDSTMLMAASGLPFKKIGLIAAKDYFFDQSHRFYLHYMMNLVPIARGTGSRALKDTILACSSFLDQGGLALIIYPEGTRSLTGKIAKFKEGAAMIAHDLDIPLVPACVVGSHDSLGKGSYFLRPKKLAVHFGRSFKVADWLSFDEHNDRKATFNAYREAMAEVERQVREMSQRGLDV